jgi:outer membrane immunogenic protein
MKLVLASTVAMGLAAGAAAAADAPPPRIVKATPIAHLSSWTGWYLGSDVGLRATTTDVNTTAAALGPDSLLFPGTPTSAPVNGAGFRFGGYLGYNLQFAPQWVTGVEAGIGFADSKTTLNGFLLPGPFPLTTAAGKDTFSLRSTWDGSLRGRFGFLATPRSLLYFTGGLAWQHVEATISAPTCLTFFFGSCLPPGFNDGMSATKTGWTIGGGFESVLWGNWIARAEYRYADLGTATFSTSNTVIVPLIVGPTPEPFTTSHDERLRTHTAAFGLAYKFGDPAAAADTVVAMPVKARPMTPSFNWTGPYAGIDAGMRSTRTDLTTDAFLFPTAFNLTGAALSEPLDGTAFRLGGYLGFNWLFAPQWLVGLEGDGGWADNAVTLQGVFVPGVFASGLRGESLSTKASWDGSIRGRFGFLVTPQTLAYLTGGLAWQQFESSEICPATQCGSPINFSNSSTRMGWTVGGGLETVLWGNWLARAQYRYSDFGRTTYTSSTLTNGEFIGTTYDQTMRTHDVQFGIAFKLDVGSPSVTAKY